jgi:GxxExxY protein
VAGERPEPIDQTIEQTGGQVVDAALKVHKALGPGLLESAYEHCLAHELTMRGLCIQRQVHLPITYESQLLEEGYRIDLLVRRSVVVEVKALEALLPIHQAQLLIYLRLSSCRLGFLVNFNVPLLKQGL